jgi:branched-chain amino acid aminotransferase
MAGPSRTSAPQSDRQIWIDGELIPWAEATVHVLSHSHQRGSLVFDYMSVHQTPRGPALFRMREHVERLLESARLIGLPIERGGDELSAAIVETVRANPGATAVKVSAYFASIEVDVVPLDPHVTVAIAAYDPRRDIVEPKKLGAMPRAKTVKLWIEKQRRQRREDIVPPHAKSSSNYASPMAAKWDARQRGYDEVLLLDEDGFLAEGPTTNVFLVDVDGMLLTPPEDRVLLGITRSSILEIARDEGLPVKEQALQPDDLFAAAEAFLTGTTAGVWPIASADDRPIGSGEVPGPISRRLASRFRKITAGDDAVFASWLTIVQPG